MPKDEWGLFIVPAKLLKQLRGNSILSLLLTFSGRELLSIVRLSNQDTCHD